jgi:predicted dehydrogenase
MLCPGHESWHPSPEFYYEIGGGPIFDMGPYYLSALITLFGPIRAVQGLRKITFPTRTITSALKLGTSIPVETPTHIVALLEFVNRAQAQFTASFDIQATQLPPIEIYGSEGSMLVPDPNSFGNGGPNDDPLPIQIFRKSSKAWSNAGHTHAYASNSRGLGVLDQVRAIREGRLPRASGQLGLHVLEAMEKILHAAESGTRLTLESTIDRPEAMPAL